MQFDQLLVFSVVAIITAILLLSLFRFRLYLGLAPLYVTLGVFQPIQVFLASSFYVEILPGIVVSPGSVILFTSSLFVVLLAYVQEDALEARNAIFGIISANLVTSLLLFIFGMHVDFSGTHTLIGISRDLFSQNARIMLTGTVMLFADIVLIIFVYELFGRLIKNTLLLRIYFTMSAILVFDSIGFSTGAFWEKPNYSTILISGIIGKLVMATFFAVALTIYLKFFEPKKHRSVDLTDIFNALTYRQKYEVELKRVGQAEAELFQWEQIFLSAGWGVIIMNPFDDTILAANNSFAQMHGYKKDEVVGMNQQEMFTPELKGDLQKQKHLLHKCENITFESMHIRKDGHKFPVLIDINEIKDKEGNVQYHVANIQDITDRKRAETNIAAEKERLAVTLRSIGDGVVATDTNGNITTINKAAESLTQWDAIYATGRTLPEVLHVSNELTNNKMESLVGQVLKTGTIEESTNHNYLISKNGRKILIAYHGAPIRNKLSEIIGAVFVFRDMTEKQELDDYMQKSQKLESLGILAGGIAHDFNNILSGIFGFTELAIDQTIEQKVTGYLTESLNSINRARDLTQQLLTFAKGGDPIKKVENLFPFIQETTQFALSGSAVSSRFEIDENLWPCSFDRNQIGQVVDNIVINAKQAMPNGGIIDVSARNISLAEKEHISLYAGIYVKLTIKDNGIGIPAELLPRIFDPYFTTKETGHGLGLPTCYSIVKKHRGCIDVTSEQGNGTSFYIYLPASTSSKLDTSLKTDEAEWTHKGSGTFLVMDDEDALCAIMEVMLEDFGYTVVITKNGKDAVDFFREETNANRKIAGMIFDLTIPGGMGGKEAVVEIRKISKNIPVFVSSGYSADPIMANPEKYGFTASISKPFMIDEFSEMLEKHLGVTQ